MIALFNEIKPSIAAEPPSMLSRPIMAASTRVKSNAVAYAPAPRKKGRKTRGRPKTYGKKIKLKSLLANVKSMQQVASPVYGEGNATPRM